MQNVSYKICVEKNCGKKYWARGFCQYHYYSIFWNPNNRKRIREIQRKHYWENLDKYRAKGRLDQSRRRGTLNYKYSEYKKAAKDSNREFSLTKEDFMVYWQKPCFYCGRLIETIGLDRIDNHLGYIETNVIPCCIRCNKMKKDMEYNKFIELCKLISTKPNPFAR